MALTFVRSNTHHDTQTELTVFHKDGAGGVRSYFDLGIRTNPAQGLTADQLERLGNWLVRQAQDARVETREKSSSDRRKLPYQHGFVWRKTFVPFSDNNLTDQ